MSKMKKVLFGVLLTLLVAAGVVQASRSADASCCNGGSCCGQACCETR